MRASVLAAVLVCVATASSSANLVSDGGFEQFVIDEPSLGINNSPIIGGSPVHIGGWTISGHSVDVVRSYWEPAEGCQSIDLSGVQRGGLYQQVATEPGALYHLRFAAAPNPDYPGLKAIQIRWSGQILGIVEMWPDGCTRDSMGWRYVDFQVTGSGLDQLWFISWEGQDCYGPAIDDVSLVLVPEPGSLVALAASIFCLISRRRR